MVIIVISNKLNLYLSFLMIDLTIFSGIEVAVCVGDFGLAVHHKRPLGDN